EIRSPWALEIQPFEKKGRRAADRDNIATHFLKLHGYLLRASEAFEELVLMTAPKSYTGGNDLYPVGRVLVPKSERLPTVRRFNQTNPCAPSVHNPPLAAVYSSA